MIGQTHTLGNGSWACLGGKVDVDEGVEVVFALILVSGKRI